MVEQTTSRSEPDRVLDVDPDVVPEHAATNGGAAAVPPAALPSRREHFEKQDRRAKVHSGGLVLFLVAALTFLGWLKTDAEVGRMQDTLGRIEARPADSPYTLADSSTVIVGPYREALREQIHLATTTGKAISFSFIAAFIALGFLAMRYPVIACVSGLALYAAVTAVAASFDSVAIMQSFFLRIVIVTALIGAITAERTKYIRRHRRLNQPRPPLVPPTSTSKRPTKKSTATSAATTSPTAKLPQPIRASRRYRR